MIHRSMKLKVTTPPNQELKGMLFRSTTQYEQYHKGGFREKYAMENGNKSIVYIRGHKCFKYTYDKYREYQDANGATYDTLEKKWIN